MGTLNCMPSTMLVMLHCKLSSAQLLYDCQLDWSPTKAYQSQMPCPQLE